MATDKQKRSKLVSFLDEKAFDPILRASEDKYSSEDQKQKLEDVKKSTRSEKKRFHDDYGSASEVKENYLSDLNSRTAKKKNAELEELGLPTLPRFKTEFLDLCSELDV